MSVLSVPPLCYHCVQFVLDARCVGRRSVRPWPSWFVVCMHAACFSATINSNKVCSIYVVIICHCQLWILHIFMILTCLMMIEVMSNREAHGTVGGVTKPYGLQEVQVKSTVLLLASGGQSTWLCCTHKLPLMGTLKVSEFIFLV